MNRLLEDRLDALRTTLDQLSSTLDENLQILLLNLTCDPAAKKSTPKPIDELARAVREKCLEFMVREHPMAHDLKFAMATLRVGQDYERMGEISLTLNKRVEFLRHTAFQDICKGMTGVMAAVLNMNKLVQNTWKRAHRALIAPTQAQVAKLAKQVAA